MRIVRSYSDQKLFKWNFPRNPWLRELLIKIPRYENDPLGKWETFPGSRKTSSNVRFIRSRVERMENRYGMI